MKSNQMNHMEHHNHPHLPFVLGLTVMFIKSMFFEAHQDPSNLTELVIQFSSKLISVVFWGFVTGIIGKLVGKLWDKYWYTVWSWVRHPIKSYRRYKLSKLRKKNKKKQKTIKS